MSKNCPQQRHRGALLIQLLQGERLQVEAAWPSLASPHLTSGKHQGVCDRILSWHLFITSGKGTRPLQRPFCTDYIGARRFRPTGGVADSAGQHSPPAPVQVLLPPNTITKYFRAGYFFLGVVCSPHCPEGLKSISEHCFPRIVSQLSTFPNSFLPHPPLAG